MSDFDLDVPLPKTRATIGNGGASMIARMMPVGASRLCDSVQEAQAIVMAMRYQKFRGCRQKRTMEKNGEVGWRVWKLGNL